MLCVDYVNKQWERGGDGCALRNVKLRFSRKLMFAAGLLTCFACRLDEARLNEHDLFKNETDAKNAVEMHIQSRIGVSPLDIVCERLLAFDQSTQTAPRMLLAYDGFLCKLGEPETRDALKRLNETVAESDRRFGAFRDLSHEFQDALTSLFFDLDPVLTELTRRYGVF